MYDIFVYTTNNKKSKNFKKLKEKYPSVKIASSIKEAAKKNLTRFFWIVHDDILINASFDFSYEPDDFSQNIIHVFRNGDYFDGIFLIPKNNLPSQKEFEHRFFVNKKEVNIQASVPTPYSKFYINTYDDYLKAVEKSETDFFWVIPNDIILREDFDFSYQAAHWEKYPHIFLNGEYHDGISLHNKENIITKKEFDYGFVINKKETYIQASTPKPFDIVFISYNEPNAEQNFQKLKIRFPRAKRVHGVKGIHNAHIEAAKKVDTEMFWVVDADAEIVDGFNFDYQVPKWDQDAVHVWRSKNPVNELVYGYGGVKLLPTKMTIDMDNNKPDMTTSISSKFKAVEEISNITAFNTDTFNAWKSAFRECAKLSSRIIDNQDDLETMERLDIWCNVGVTEPYGVDTVRGAKEGRKFGEENKGNVEQLSKINNFDWLKERFYAKH